MIETPRGPFSGSDTMRQLIRYNYQLLPVISRFNIAFGFGDRTIEDICHANQVDLRTFLSVCNLISGLPYEVEGLSLPALMGFLRRAHSSFLDVALPKIRRNIIDAINHIDTDEVALLLIRFYDDYVSEVRRHMEHENQEVFGYIQQLLDGQLRPGYSIAAYNGDHEPMNDKLHELKDIFIYHYKQRDNDRLSATLFDIITCENDLQTHFLVEDRLLVPVVEALEQQVAERHEAIAQAAEAAEDQDDTDSCTLTAREVDIVCCVARGMANKEIADKLCISAHTVATHRRNISSKLEIHSPAGLVIYAIIHGLVDISEVKPN